MEVHFAGNLKNLRETYGETQMELADALELDSVGAISNYEKGTRMPERDVLLKIAGHYRITLDELLYSEFHYGKTDWKEGGEKIKNDALRTILALLPVLTPKNKETDPQLLRGLELHRKYFRLLREGKDLPDDEMEECLDAYYASWETGQNPAAAANLAGLCLLTGFMPDDYMIQGREILQPVPENQRALLLEFYLRSYENGRAMNAEEEKARRADLDPVDAEIVDLLRPLKNTRGWGEWADYCSALRYVLKIADTPVSDELKAAAGDEMMRSLSLFGNRFAKRYARLKGL